ncbi:unnamed protein product [Caenorhabditis nigoni]
MELSSDFIKKNQHFLKSCILYEVLQKKPVFDAYRNFCNTVGKDAMNYPDFEFWYYQFYHGNRDFDYDRSADPEPKTFVDLPVVLMTKIARYLDPVERTFLRSINHAIKDVADSLPPIFEEIELTVLESSMYWKLNGKKFGFYKKESGCTIEKPNSTKEEKSEECFIKKGIENLAPVLKKPNLQVNHVLLHLFNETPDLLPVPLNPKSTNIYSHNTNQVVQFLSAMNPGHLEAISLNGLYSIKRENYGMIFETDQIKQAKSVNFPMGMEFNVEDFVRVSQLKNFKCYLTSENALEDVPRIRDGMNRTDIGNEFRGFWK